MKESQQGARIAVFLIWAGVATLVAGVWLSVLSVAHIDRESRRELLNQAQTLVHALSPVRIQALAQHPASDGPEYLRVRRQLMLARPLIPKCRFLYLMHRLPDGRVAFLADSEPESSPDYSPPGQVYPEASLKLLALWRSGAAFTEGPEDDRWGRWISALAPVTDPSSREVIAVLGLDVDARDWILRQWQPIAPLIAATVVLFLLLCGTGLILKAQAIGRISLPSRWRPWIEPGLVGITGTVLSATIAVMMWQFDGITARRHASNLAISTTESVVWYMKAIRDRDMEAIVRNVTIAPERPDRLRVAVNHLTQDHAQTGWWLVRWRETSPTAPSHLDVIEHVGRPEAPDHLAGGLQTYPGLETAIREAQQTGWATAAKPVKTTGGQYVVMAVKPADPGDRSFVILEFDPAAIIQHAVDTSVWMYDQPATMRLGWLNPDGSDMTLAEVRRRGATAERRPEWVTAPVFMFGAMFTIGVDIAAHRPHLLNIGAVLLLGLAVTAVAAALVTLFVQQRDALERAVAARTQELRHRQELLTRAEALARLGHFRYQASDRALMECSDTIRDMAAMDHTTALVQITPVLERVHPDDQAVLQTLSAGLQSDGEAAGELRLIRPDGEVVWVRIQAQAERDSVTGDVYVFGTMQDVTVARNTEEEQRRLRDQLDQAARMESVGRLAGGVAHDINNTLQAISGFAQMALERPGIDPEVASDLDEIRQAATRSSDLTRQLLAFARRQVIKPVELDLNAAVNHVAPLIRQLLPADIELQWRPGALSHMVCMDPSQIDQILINLVVNARDAIGSNGIVLVETSMCFLDEHWCDGHPPMRPGLYVVLSVSDTGAGMTPEVARHIFEPFYTTKDVGEGAGLGLATVYGIMQQNGGYVTVYSEPGMGATFHVYMPAAPAVIAGEPTPVEPVRGGSETILLAEDEASLLRLAYQMLTSLGYRVLSAQHGAEALSLARLHDQPIDLLLTDVVMPYLDGPGLARELKSVHPGVRVLYMSGYPASLIQSRGVVADSVPILAKPFSRETLALAVRSALDA